MMRRINLAYVPIRIDVLPADPEINPVYRAASLAFVQPYSLAASLGRLREETSVRALARAYAEGVICGSPDDEYIYYDREDWVRWLTAHPEEFGTIRSICEVRKNFEDPDELPAP